MWLSQDHRPLPRRCQRDGQQVHGLSQKDRYDSGQRSLIILNKVSKCCSFHALFKGMVVIWYLLYLVNERTGSHTSGHLAFEGGRFYVLPHRRKGNPELIATSPFVCIFSVNTHYNHTFEAKNQEVQPCAWRTRPNPFLGLIRKILMRKAHFFYLSPRWPPNKCQIFHIDVIRCWQSQQWHHQTNCQGKEEGIFFRGKEEGIFFSPL